MAISVGERFQKFMEAFESKAAYKDFLILERKPIPTSRVLNKPKPSM